MKKIYLPIFIDNPSGMHDKNILPIEFYLDFTFFVQKCYMKVLHTNKIGIFSRRFDNFIPIS